MLSKKIVSIVFLSFSIGISVTAQNNNAPDEKVVKENKTEISIGVSNIFADPFSNILLYEYSDYYYPDLFLSPMGTGLNAGIKFHNAKGAIRINSAFYYKKHSYTNPDVTTDENIYKSLATDLSLGNEWHTVYKRTTIFYGFDFNLGYQNFQTNHKDFEDQSESKYRVFKYGFSPLLGVNYFLTSNLSIGTEIKFNAFRYSGKSESTYNYGLPPYTNYGSSKNEFNGFQTHFGPLGYLSINIHF